MMDVKYPKIEVRLTGIDSNAFSVMGAVQAGLRRGGVSRREQDAFRDEAMAGDYDALLRTCMRWVTVL